MKKIFFFLGFAFLAKAQAPAGYYNSANGLTGANLKTALSTIITNGHQDKGYNGLWTGYKTTDIDKNYENDGSILDIYSEKPTTTDPYKYTPVTNQCGTYSVEGNCYNREHIVPQSLFNEASPMVSDIHFIRATDGKVNGMRSNYPFGKVGTATFTSKNGSKLGSSASSGYSGTVFEPIDEFKGDVARMIFYFVTRYQNKLSSFTSGNMLGSSAYPGLQTWELNVLLAWHNQDPVSQAEINRNNASYTYQGNRNPFIDNPSYVNLIWGSQQPATDTQAPTAATGLAVSGTTSSSISLTWNPSTDNVGVTSYNVYMNGSLKTTVSSTSATISGLSSSTTYSFYVVAKDAAGNSSSNSSTVSGTTSGTITPPTNCVNETFESIPTSSSSSYLTRTWTNNGISWTATDARTDQTISNLAITVRDGSLKSNTSANGIGSLTVTTQLKFTGTNGTFNVQVNGVTVGTIPYSTTATTTTINNINTSGNVVVTLTNSSSTNRVAIDNLSWTCYSGTSRIANSNTPNLTTENNSLKISQNPISNQEIFVKGETENIQKAEIYNLQGKLMQTINQPFKNNRNSIKIKNLEQGVYILKLDQSLLKFIVK
ncbi:endonuclease [Chryseobacterium geocarposphaerae]|uniref:Putative secreted protein (Por secretion system target) n=1 Tax=Chryseobacterium geocarposphaerae TaxID=1416776 RepID=A0A2M9CA27_9FLAO|nr:endonuclease [Chryseobacterium geocarposphaerae]PJJ67685.1 putative secreted protein (Por secretion system target) [Chryseobacterium geocarposphaerae]